MKLRYLSILLISLFAVINDAKAQHYGAKAGLNLSTLNGYGLNINPGVQIGAFTELGRSEPLYFKGEALLSQKGSWNWNFNNLNNINLYYLDIAVMFGLEIFKGFSINLGFQPSLRISGTQRFHGEDGNINFRNVSGNSALLDYSTLMGVEYEFKTNEIVGIRFAHGFVPIQSYGGVLQLNDKLPFNYNLQIYYGMKIGKLNEIKDLVKSKLNSGSTEE